MPNQRSENKLYLGGFVEKELHAKVVRLAKKAGMEKNKFGFVQMLVREAIERRKTKQKAPKKAASSKK